jgi:UDP-2-acetamido-2-deoxy-ribo-hexuluronate aminotransferase
MQFVDLKKQYDLYKDEIHEEMDKVLQSSAFINGPACTELEQDLSTFCGSPYSLSCSSGTDALLLPMMAWNIGPGDEVIVPAFTFIATASMVAFLGAKPVFVDVDPVTFNLDPALIEEKITKNTKAIIPVSLYGQCADMDAINAIAAKYNIPVIEDAAQSFGATYKGRFSCNLSTAATTSFFPAKPLGGYGDGGAVFTADETLAETMGYLKSHGQVKRYHHKYVGINGRMDTLQAAVVKVKLRHFADELKMRQKVADMYTESLKNLVETPVVLEHNTSTWAQYTIRVDNRDAVQEALKEKGIPTAVHYPVPLAKQEAFKPYDDGCDYPVSNKLSQRVMSLPMHALLTEQEIETVCTALKTIL